MLSTVRAVVMCAALAAGLAGAPAAAQTAPTYVFDVAPQPLSAAVLAFARQANVQVVFGAPVAQGLMSTPLVGRYSLQDAMTRLLTGTGLDWRMAGGTITITPAAPSGTLTFGTITVEGTQPPFPDLRGFGAGAGANGSSDPTATEGTHSFTTNGATVASPTALPLLEIPQTVAVVTQEQIKQQNMTDVASVLNYVPGVTLNRETGIQTAFLSRGFQITRFRLDGSSAISLANNNQADLSEFDNVQVLRGSDGLLGGNDTPGGVVDLQRKRPLDHVQLVAEADVGSWNSLYGTFDASGPLDGDGHIRGRAVLAVSDQDEFYDVTHKTLTHLYGVIEGDIDPDTIVRVGGSYGAEHDPGFNDNGLPAGSTGLNTALPVSTCLCAPWNRFDRTTTEAFIALDHRFAGDWDFKVNAVMLGEAARSKAALIFGPGEMLSYQEFDTTGFSEHDYTLRAVGTGTVAAFGVPFHVAVGADYTRRALLSSFADFEVTPVDVDVAHFDPAVLGPEPDDRVKPELSGRVNDLYEEAGLFANVRFDPIDQLHIALGARVNFDHLRQEQSSFHNNGVTTPYAALSYDLRRDLAAYVSYADIYQGQSGLLTKDLVAVPPHRGETFEVGLKAAPWDGRLNASVALYDSVQSNQTIVDPTVPFGGIPNCCYITVGSQRSAGLDMEVAGEILPGWQVRGGYTYNTNGYSAALRRQLAAINIDAQVIASLQPKNQFKIWSSYAIDMHWTAGAGLRFESDRYSDSDVVGVAPRLLQPPYAVLDLRGAYRFNESWEAALNVTNVADARYFETTGSAASGNFYGEPRGVTFSLRATY